MKGAWGGLAHAPRRSLKAGLHPLVYRARHMEANGDVAGSCFTQIAPSSPPPPRPRYKIHARAAVPLSAYGARWIARIRRHPSRSSGAPTRLGRDDFCQAIN